VRALKTFTLLVGAVWMAPAASAADFSDMNFDLNTAIIIDKKPIREYIPYKLDEICKQYVNNTCSIKYNANEIVRMAEKRVIDGVEKEVVYFEGTATQYVDFLNEKERELTQLGASLRDNVDKFDLRKVPTDIIALRKSLLETFGIFAPELLARIREPIPNDQCSQIPDVPVDDLPKKVIELSDGKLLKVPALIMRLNESQRILCALGYDLFDSIDVSQITTNMDGIFGESLEKQESLFDQLGLSMYSPMFNLEDIEKLKPYGEIAKDVYDIVQAKQFPGPEQIFDLRNKINAQLPTDAQIPDIPSIPAPSAPKRIDLALKKRKDWTGFNFGDRNMVATGANAFMEVRGSKIEEALTAEGKASIYILGREINALGGYAQLQAGPSQVSAHVEFKSFGQDIFEPIDEKASVQFVKDVPDAFVWSFDKAYSTQFMIGPVPVDLRVGGVGKVGLGYAVAIETTRLNGSIYPRASIEGYAAAAAGVRQVLAVGAEAKITLLELRVPLTGGVGFQFDDVGYPNLVLNLNSEATYEYLNGSINAFVEYPVPAARLPPWKTKRDSTQLFAFQGQKKTHKIMNYKIELGRKGAKTSGDLIDQADQTESKALEEAILADQRNKALTDLETKVNLEVRNIFQGILTDLGSTSNQKAGNQSEEVRVFSEQFASNLNALGANAAEAASR
jgi:hypothetical protein